MASRGIPFIVAFLLGAFVIAPIVARAPDVIPPWGTAWGPMGTGVSVQTNILVAWSERMDLTSVEAAFTYSDGVVAHTQGAWTHDGTRNTSTFAPATPLNPGTRYTVRFATTAKDVSGNRLDQNRNGVGGEPCEPAPPGISDCLVWTFDTAPLAPDTVPPTVLATSPRDGGLAATNATIQVVFSETMDAPSVESAFRYSDGYSLYALADGTASWTMTSFPDDTLWFISRLEFANGGRITGYLFENGAKDLAGNLLDGDRDGRPGGAFAWTFFVASDPDPPRVLSTAPVAGAMNVSVSTPIRASFTKSMSIGSVAAGISLRGPGGENLTINDGIARWSGTRFPDDTLSFDPYPNLRTSSAYTFSISAGVATDREGLHLDGNGNGTADGSPGDDFRLTFRTEARDGTPPSVAQRYPKAGAQDVHPATSIEVIFSEPMNRTSVEASFRYTDGVRAFGTADGSAAWSLADTNFVFRPASSLAYGRQYTVTLSGSVARDGAGNRLNGGENETWGFTTASQPDVIPPGIVFTSPFDGQRNVSRSARITVIFSEAMDKASTEGAMGITGSASLIGFRWPNDATLEAVTAVSMDYRASYTVIVFSGAKDLAGNRLQQPTQITFTTESWRGRVSGHVADEAGVPVAGALVKLDGFSFVTDDLGSFFFDRVEQGTYTLTVSHEGYATSASPLTILPGGGGLGTIILRRPSVSLIDATLWASIGGAFLVVLLIAMWLRRRRMRPAQTYETWKPAKVVVVEPGTPPRKGL